MTLTKTILINVSDMLLANLELEEIIDLSKTTSQLYGKTMERVSSALISKKKELLTGTIYRLAISS